MRLFGKAQPKEEHPSGYCESASVYASCATCHAVYERESGHRCIFPFGHSGVVNPPRGGSVIAQPGGQSNRALIALMKSIEREIAPSPRVDSRLIGEECR